MNSFALRPIISFGEYPSMVSAARAHLNQDSLWIGHQDQVLRSFEDTAPLLDLLAKRLLGFACFR